MNQNNTDWFAQFGGREIPLNTGNETTVLKPEDKDWFTQFGGYEVKEQSPEASGDGLMRKVGVTAKGFAEGVGGLVDAGAAIGNASLNDGSFTYDDNPPIDKSVVTPSDKPFTPTNDVTAQNYLGNQVNKLFGTNLDPKDAFEKFLNLAGAFSVPLGTGSKGSGILKNLANHELAAAGGATGVVAAEEAGIENPLIKMAASGVGAGVGLGVGATLPKAIKATSNAANSAVAKTTGYTAKNMDLPAIEAAERIGVDLPTTAANTSTGLATTEQVLQRLPFAGNKHNKNLRNLNEKFADKIKSTFDDIGESLSNASTKGEASHEVGTKSQEVLANFSKSLKDESKQLYENADTLLPKDATHIPNKTISAIKKLKEHVSKSFSPTEDAKYIIKTLNEIENNLILKSQFGDLKIPPKVENLIATKTSLNDKIDWDINASGSKKQLRFLKKAIDEDLAEYGKTNSQWFNAYKEADKFYGKYLGDKALASETLKKIIAEENPEKILGSLNKVSDFQYIENVLGKTEEGKKFFDSLKREKFESLFDEKILETSATDSSKAITNVKHNPLSKLLNDPTKSTLIKYLVGDSNFNKVKDLVTYSKAMVGRQIRNPNASGTAPTSIVLNWMLGLGTFGASTAAPLIGVSSVKTAGLALSFPVILYKTINNKKLMNYAVNAAKAQQKGDMVNATKWGKLADKTALEELGEKAFKELSKPKEKA